MIRSKTPLPFWQTANPTFHIYAPAGRETLVLPMPCLNAGVLGRGPW